MNIDKELKKDFETCLEKIDFNSYNPLSSDFQKTLNVALMMYLLKVVNNEDEIVKVMSEKSDKADEEKSDDKISEEISDAKKYFQKYLDSGEEMYKNMAMDEIKHGNFLIKKAYSKLPSAEDKNKLKAYEHEINEISTQLNKE